MSDQERSEEARLGSAMIGVGLTLFTIGVGLVFGGVPIAFVLVGLLFIVMGTAAGTREIEERKSHPELDHPPPPKKR